MGSDRWQYLAVHPAFPTTFGTEPVIAKVLFIPASQASALMRGESIGRPDTTLVCCKGMRVILLDVDPGHAFVTDLTRQAPLAAIGHRDLDHDLLYGHV